MKIALLMIWHIRYILLILILLQGNYGYCQLFEVTGIVSDADNRPVPGVTVLEPGTTNGTITNLEGYYNIEVSSAESSLEFRFVGMETQVVPVNGQSEVNVLLAAELYTVDEVVVTALGISKEAKSLGYSVTAVDSEELTQGGDKSMLNALQGKIAGVNITSASGAPGSSTRILVRGVSSLSGGNQPLFIVDGVPVNNTQTGSSSINGGTDFGNKINDINTEDIESVSFLKGASGTALYGSRAANGVVVISTKKGSAKSKAGISYKGGIGFERPLRLVKYQNDYGQGIFGNYVLYENMSWGPKFDNKFRPWGNEIDNTLLVKSYRPLPDNVREFFETGLSTNHSLAVNGGNDITTYYLSYGNVYWDGIFPTNSDSYKKHSISLRGSQKISDAVSVQTSINYLRKNTGSVPTGQGDASVYNQIMQTPRDISLLEQEDVGLEWNNPDNHYSQYTVNPYYILKNNRSINVEDRVLGSLEINISLPLSISATGRVGGDMSNENRKEWREIVNPEGNNESSSVFDPGSKARSSVNRQQINSDAILSWEKQLGSFSFNLMGGHSLNERKTEGFGTGVSSLALEGFRHLSNSTESPSSFESTTLVRLMGIYSGLDIAYKSIYFLSTSIRKEWSSTLPSKNNSYIFPNINSSFVFTEVLDVEKDILTFGKLRMSWGKVGNGAPPYFVEPIFQQAGHSDGFGFFTYPTSSGINSYEIGSFIGNPELKPEMTTEYEFGADLRLFNNRFAIDLAYYNKSTKDLIWATPVSSASGYNFKMQNLGHLVNYGIESLVKIKPVDRSKFTWEITLNFTRNFNELISLNNQLESAELNALRVDGGQQISWLAIPGEPVGIFEARGPRYTNDGKMIVDNQGLPIADEELKRYGNSQYKYYGGIINTLTYKGITLNINLDYRVGGMMYSRTKDITMWAGTVPQTLYNDREPFIIPNSVYETRRDENGDPVYAENTIPIDRVKLVEYWGNGGSELDGASLIDKSFVKLREVSLRYVLPGKWTERLPVKRLTIGASGKNLLLWTPEDQIFIDPELTTFGNDFGADFGEYGAQPSVRSITFNLNVDF